MAGARAYLIVFSQSEARCIVNHEEEGQVNVRGQLAAKLMSKRKRLFLLAMTCWKPRLETALLLETSAASRLSQDLLLNKMVSTIIYYLFVEG